MATKLLKKFWLVGLAACLCATVLHTGCVANVDNTQTAITTSPQIESSVVDETQFGLPAYTGEAYTEINGMEAVFTENELTSADGTEIYGALDDLGRCTYAFAKVSPLTLPNEDRGDISKIKPSGWHSIKFDFIDGGYLYNRCHLIGYQLTAENANAENLITGTRYMNVDGMLPFENYVSDHVAKTGNTVLYKVVPAFVGDELIARGVFMSARSLDDNGEGVNFNIFCHNIQPNVEINYLTGDAKIASDDMTEDEWIDATSDDAASTTSIAVNPDKLVYITKSGKKYHADEHCSDMKNPTRTIIDDAVAKGYEPCKKCIH